MIYSFDELTLNSSSSSFNLAFSHVYMGSGEYGLGTGQLRTGCPSRAPNPASREVPKKNQIFARVRVCV